MDGMEGSRRLEEPPLCWYFAFGGNMSQRTLERRGVSSKKRCAGQLVGHRLVFSYDGYAGVEPRFANIEPVEQSPAAAAGVSSGSSPCHDVAHLISEEDLLLLDKFEGAGYSYERVVVKMRPYEKDRKAVLDWKKTTQGLNHSEALPDDMISAFVYVAMESHRAEPGLPSRRYLKILVDGAVANGLDAAYVEALRAQPAYDSRGTLFPTQAAPPGAPTLTFEQIADHGYAPRENKDEPKRAVWVHIGGLVFDVSDKAKSRAMLRNMSGGKGATRFVCQMWSAAFGSPYLNESSCKDETNQDVHLSMLKGDVRDYVASWAQNLIAQKCPCVGVSSHFAKRSVSAAASRVSEASPLPEFSKDTLAAIQAASHAVEASTQFDSHMYYFELGVAMPMTLTVCVRTRTCDAPWWQSNETSLLCELSAGINANVDALFDNIRISSKAKRQHDDASTESATYVPLKTIVFRYTISEMNGVDMERITMAVQPANYVDVSGGAVAGAGRNEATKKKRRKRLRGDDEASVCGSTLKRRLVMPFLMTCTVLKLKKDS